jgi:hypothetical protein
VSIIRNEPPLLGTREHDAIARATDFATGATGYHSVAGKTAQGLLGTAADTNKPLTLLDFIDDRIRGIDAERNRLSMLRDQLLAADCNPDVDVIRRVLG